MLLSAPETSTAATGDFLNAFLMAHTGSELVGWRIPRTDEWLA